MMPVLWDVGHTPLLVFAVAGYRWGNKRLQRHCQLWTPGRTAERWQRWGLSLSDQSVPSSFPTLLHQGCTLPCIKFPLPVVLKGGPESLSQLS